MKFLTLFLLILLSGCAPWPTTSQPEVNLRVVDKNGVPIKGAIIKFVNYKIAIKPEVEFKEIHTDDSGNAYLSKKSYTQMVVLAGFTQNLRTHQKRPIMAVEVCHAETQKILRG
ncbi:MAG: hypothetical protein AB2794_18670, partial [Candidatus Thiodiazotropha endolucinida]